MMKFSINYSEAGTCFKGDNLTLRELNNRLARIVSMRLNEKDQSPWYYKTSVTMRHPDIEYTARIDVCPKFCSGVWIHRIFQCHIENGLKYAYRMRNKKEFIGRMARDQVKAAVKVLKVLRVLKG